MLPDPSPSAVLTAWTVQPVAIAVVALLVAWYVRAGRSGRASGAQRTVFAIGIVSFVWATCGFAGVYLDDLFWVWTAQQLALLLVVPYFVLAGGPIELAGATGRRLIELPVVRALGNPLVGPALVPLLSVLLFFGPLPRWAIAVPVVGWIEQVLVVLIGAVIVLPLTGAVPPRSSLAVGLALGIGSFELVLDAVPGIVLRLHRSLSTSYFDARALHSWTPHALHDQQLAGAVLWAVAELLDLPFLVLVYRLWIRADAKDAADIDAVLDAERAARGDPSDDETRDAPWWLSDPSMRDRLNRPR